MKIILNLTFSGDTEESVTSSSFKFWVFLSSASTDDNMDDIEDFVVRRVTDVSIVLDTPCCKVGKIDDELFDGWKFILDSGEGSDFEFKILFCIGVSFSGITSGACSDLSANCDTNFPSPCSQKCK